ncbi:putative sulfate transport system substrate-binding protein [Ferrimonas balearica DSM 9799]|uniref:Putative sulfate transport system substrate-binding protein n=1 Tax=Ferrimonas balearica (strain DSM 9799 / CCM 4581 / KCTC 23876 / PAT) TaxID=550540 RepID=E1SPI0_FERBD|nr:substrate-binding domain-containing protein [Ferrimonas balearica]ADN77797.1 putative sulfate transport system substrate-binding protein [Ferrimonas balearica DSM 9799]
MKRTLSKVLLLLALMPGLALANEPVRLATTTSTDNSGLLAYLLPEFEKASGYSVQVIATGTGKALRHGRNGDVDVVMTHAPSAEAKFVEDGFGRLPRQLMVNDFILLGPASDPADVASARSAADAMRRIHDAQAPFVSRGDESGTHIKELALWRAARVNTNFTGYSAIGQGMGPALLTASEMQGYLLADRGTYLAFKDKLNLAVLYQGDANLMNPYQVILINTTTYPDLNHAGAEALSDWLVSEKGQQMINDFKVSGEQLFRATYKATE